MDEQFLNTFPISLLFGYFTYKLIDNYFYFKYCNLNKCLDDLYYDINGTMYKVKNNKKYPLECSRNLLNFNQYGDDDSSDDDSSDNESSDNDSSDEINNKNENTLKEEKVNNDSNDSNDSNISNIITSDLLEENEIYNDIIEEIYENDIEPNIDFNNLKDFNIFIITNYSEQIKKTNNPFYKGLNIVVDVLLNKNSDNEDLEKYLEQLDWKLEDFNEEYYKLEIINNNIEYIFDKLFGLFSKYYGIYSNVNVIFNHNELNEFRKNIFSSSSSYKIINNKPTYKYLHSYNTFDLISMYDLYGYINNNKNELDYNNINFEKFQDLIDYYNLESINLENTEDKDSGVFESILNKFY